VGRKIQLMKASYQVSIQLEGRLEMGLSLYQAPAS
jgi:hypothetical protein